jgi:hypothetical protein
MRSPLGCAAAARALRARAAQLLQAGFAARDLINLD